MRILTVLEIENVWEPDARSSLETVQISCSMTGHVQIERLNKDERLIFSTEEWQAVIDFVQGEAEKNKNV